ncbi:MAG: hypothetical protein AAB410_01780 [Patescibacteria group bacterium]
MLKFSSPRSYAFLTGLVLFLLGFIGFAFRSNFGGIDNGYLLASLLLGFWGLVVSVQKE